MNKSLMCPKHKLPIDIAAQTIEFAGSVQDVFIGTCPKCNIAYISKQIMMSSRVTISGKQYEFLPELQKITGQQTRTTPAKSQRPTQIEDIEQYFLKAEIDILKEDEIENLKNENHTLLKRVEELSRLLAISERKSQSQLNALQETFAAQIKQEKRTTEQLNKKTVKEYEKRIEKINRAHAQKISHLQNQLQAVTRSYDVAQKNFMILQNENLSLSRKVHDLSKQIEEISPLARPVIFTDKKLYVCGGVIRCEKHNHERKDVTGIIDTIAGTPITMTVCYCKNCKLYYVKDAVFESYRSQYGTLLGQFVRKEDGMTLGRPSNYGELAPESVLHMNGYNVSQARDLSAAERRKILAYIIESQIMDKNDIRKHLSYLIKMNRSNPYKEAAVEKWTSDVNWVNDYRSGGQDFVWLSGTAMYRNRQRKI